MSGQAKVALVTGASRGIGKAISIDLAKNGFDVALGARSVREYETNPWPGDIHQTAELVRQQGARALPIQADLNNTEEVRRMVDLTMSEFGRIDVMVNNARYMGPAHWSKFLETDWDDLEQTVNINVTAVLLFHHLCAPIMVKQGGGIFINLTTAEAFTDYPGLPGQASTGISYPVTKAAFHRIAQVLSKEMRDYNIAVINLSPGFVLTERSVTDVAGRGYDMSTTHSVWVPARAAAYLATAENPMEFSGQYIEARPFVEERGLMMPEELQTPWKG